METTTLQIPISKDLKSNATVVAQDYGFSSLQEIVRVILTKLARRQLVVQIEEVPIKLSEGAARKYSQMEHDFTTGKNSQTFSSVDGLMKDLRS